MPGVRPLSAAGMPWGVERRAPRVDPAMRLIARWYSPSMPFWPLQVSSDVVGRVWIKQSLQRPVY